MKMKKYNYFLFATLLMVFVGCNDERYDETTREDASLITLRLPRESVVEVNTRAVSDENTVNDLLVFVFRDGAANYESFSSPTVTNNAISFQLSKFSVADGETLYVCCNTGVTTINATTAEDFFEQLTYTNSAASMIMFGSKVISGAPTAISLELKRAFAKVTLACTDGKNTIKSWKLCNVPTKGYVSEKTGYPVDAAFDETATPASMNDVVYFIPRTDNNAATEKTFLLVELDGRGWYKLEFYAGKSVVDTGDKAQLIDMERNTYYAFEILTVQNDGYVSENEAKANPGSNVLYNMSSTNNGVDSNGQYTLETDREEITLYPVASGKQSIEALHVSANIPAGADTDIATYTVRLHSPKGQIQMKDADVNGLLNLKHSGEKITKENSFRTIELYFEGASVAGSYLEVKLGNITRQVPIGVLSSNCYLADFVTAVDTELYIPVAQANADGTVRVSPDDQLTVDIVWSDQPNINLELKFDKDKQWILVKNKSTFAGNVVIAVLKNGTVTWSWHIWSMDNSVLFYDTKMGVYNFRDTHTKSYNNFVFMDRNMGAYTLDKTAQGSWGLWYQWGRKDPFPTTDITSPATDLTVYHKTSSFTMQASHPVLNTAGFAAVNSPNNLEYSISHPMTFIEGMKRPGTGTASVALDYDWFSNVVPNDYLWLDKNRQKTAYNPCPPGWTMPFGGDVGPWVGLVADGTTVKGTEGMTFANIGYVPFVPHRNFNELGNRIPSAGLLKAGFLWGNFKRNTLCKTTFFGDGSIFFTVVVDAAYRADGISVRCVREKE